MRSEVKYDADWRSLGRAPYVMFRPNYLDYDVIVPYKYDLITSESEGKLAMKLVRPEDIRDFIGEAVDVLPSFDPYCLLRFKSLLELYP